MLFHLCKLKTREGGLSSHALVSIVRLTVETNVATTTVSIVALLIVALYPDKNWFTCPTYVLGKLYSNTLLVSLNNRISIRDTYNARGAIEVGACPSSSGRSDTTGDFLVLESEKQQKQITKHPLTGVKVVSERVMNIV
ncbi:hypothetical protein BGY98DRAFT_277085 [Russula aff. rugulosa BPL654]|nr:hypothetical protein BGY98DRAFT_277085 [Russula aff. rugulosa BPL654]